MDADRSGARAVPPSPVTDLDWSPERARALGDDVVELWVDLLDGLREQPVGRSETPDDIRSALVRPVPAEPVPPDELVAHLRSLVLDHSNHPGHPGFMAYISGAGTV